MNPRMAQCSGVGLAARQMPGHLATTFAREELDVFSALCYAFAAFSLRFDKKVKELMEANNKRLRQIRTELSRKTSQQDNLTDCFKRLWTGSDPLVCQERRKGTLRTKPLPIY